MKKLLFVVSLCVLAGPAFAETTLDAPAAQCRELLVKRCQSCHYLERVCSKVGKKSERGWKATVKRMVKRRGAKLDASEQSTLVECLATPTPSVLEECKVSGGGRP